MAGITFSIPNTFAGIAGPTEPLSALDADFAAIQTALSGLVAALTDLPSAVNATGTRAWAKGVDLASAAALNLGSDGNYFVVTGTTTITSISTKQAGCIIYLRFSGALTLTHDATALILLGATNATTAAGDVYQFVSEGGGNWREVWRRPVTGATAANVFLGNGTFGTVPGSLILAGKNTTEGTTTSVAEADVVTVSSLSIATTSPVMIVAAYRKTAGAAAIASLALRLNATTIAGPGAVTTANNQAEDGLAYWYVGPQEAANYTHPVLGFAMNNAGSTVYAAQGQPNAAVPNATITSVIIRGLVGNALVTLGVKNVFVYTLPTS